MSKKRKLITSAIFSAMLSLVVAFVFCVPDVFSVKQQTTVQPFFDAEIIAVNENEQDYASLLKNFDKLEIEQEDETQRVVSSVMTMYGSNLNDIQYTSTGQDEQIIITGQTILNKITNEDQINLIFDFGEFQEYINASSNLYYDEDGNLQGKVLFDGQEYDVQEVLAMMTTDGVQECWFWFLAKIVFVVVQIAVAAKTIVDIFEYLLFEEVTVEGVLSLVCDGILLAVGCGAGAVAAKALKEGGKIALKQIVKIPETKYIKGESSKTIVNAIKYRGSEMVANGKSFSSHDALTKHFEKVLGHEKGTQVHHIVEQRPLNLRRFTTEKIHNTGNAVRIPDELHHKITGLYNSKNKALFKEITGEEVPNGMYVRDFMDKLDFDEQYRIGMEVLEHFKKTGKYAVKFV